MFCRLSLDKVDVVFVGGELFIFRNVHSKCVLQLAWPLVGSLGCVFLFLLRTQWPLCAAQVSVCKRVEMSALTGIWTGNGS